MKRRIAVGDGIYLLLRSTCILVMLLTLLNAQLRAQTTINFLITLTPYLDDDNENVKLTPETYTISENDMTNGLCSNSAVIQSDDCAILLFEVHNSTYDFTDVTTHIDTDVVQTLNKGSLPITKHYKHSLCLVNGSSHVLNHTYINPT